MKKYACVILVLIFGATLCAQEKRNLIQTNLFSFVSAIPAVNVGYVRYDAANTGFLEISLTAYLAMFPGLDIPEWRLNFYGVTGLAYPSAQLTVGYRWLEMAESKIYSGVEVRYGLLMFKNAQDICTEVQNNGGFYRCTAAEINYFTSYNHRFGTALVLGKIFDLKNGMQLDLNAKLGAYYFFRVANGIKSHVAIPGLETQKELPNNWKISHWMYGKTANLYADTDLKLFLTAGLNLRFKRF